MNNTEFLQKLPKIELHAHLSGSIRDSTIKELCIQNKIPIPEPLQHINDEIQNKRSTRSLSECFAIFRSIHGILRTKEILKRVLWEALEDYMSSGVCYLELRSTPRNMDDLDKLGYIMTVLQTMEEFELKHKGSKGLPKLSCRYIVSIDRSKDIQDAWENVKIACDIKHSNKRIVGVDVSGDPNRGTFDDFIPVLEYAKNVGKLHVTIHVGEIPCSDTDTSHFDFVDTNSVMELERADKEAKSIISFKPDRLGHALFLPKPTWQILQTLKIPIESCPTSNILTIELSSHHHEESITKALEKHPVLKQLLLNKEYPMSISTDDPGVFHTNSSRELRLLMCAFPNIVTREFIVERLVLGVVDQIFDDGFKIDLEKSVHLELECCCDGLN